MLGNMKDLAQLSVPYCSRYLSNTNRRAKQELVLWTRKNITDHEKERKKKGKGTKIFKEVCTHC